MVSLITHYGYRDGHSTEDDQRIDVAPTLYFNPYFNMFELNKNGFLKLSKKSGTRPRSRQEAPPVYQMTGLDTFNVEKFLKYKKIILPKILPFEIPPKTGIMIDTELEFKIVEMMIRQKFIKI